MRRVLLGGAAVLALASAACSSSDSADSPVSPSTAVTTDTFTGTVPIGGSDWHPFTVALSNGQVNVTLTAAGPPATIYEGVAIGTVSGATCTLITNASVVTPAGAASQLSGVVNAGAYCVEVFDAGNQTTDASYAVTVNHY